MSDESESDYLKDNQTMTSARFSFMQGSFSYLSASLGGRVNSFENIPFGGRVNMFPNVLFFSFFFTHFPFNFSRKDLRDSFVSRKNALNDLHTRSGALGLPTQI
jgi:hypothetical protein